ncbi:hypothetical protein V6N11_044472 [Hibiscus sabdariffa]|uniref:Uncharacterized protein n=1 Tax=Hibiscus sabdariffa TaxID=183260 RepID=A0ABR2RFA1_9ROSI
MSVSTGSSKKLKCRKLLKVFFFKKKEENTLNDEANDPLVVTKMIVRAMVNLESLDVIDEDNSCKPKPIDKIENVEIYPDMFDIDKNVIKNSLQVDQKARLVR